MSRNKILLVDDSITQLEMLKIQFDKAGFDVEVAKDGSEGYQKVFSYTPDLILSDILMPNLNGYQFCRLIKNDPATKEIPVILLTVLDKKIDKFWGNKSGADKFISKSTKFEEIEKEAEELIKNNPVSDEYKENLLKKVVTEDTVQNKVNVILDELLMNSTFLNEFRDLGEFISHEKILVDKIFELLGSFIDYNVAGIFFNSSDKNEKHILYLDVNKNPISGFVIEKIKREFFTQMPDMSAFTIRDFGHEVIRDKYESDEVILNSSEFKTTYILPIVSDGVLLGGICFYNSAEGDYIKFKFHKTMVQELALLFKMRYLYSETEYLSVTDGLTGLYNRRSFENNIEREFLRTKRYKSSLSLAMIDIDHFKKVNDTYGHQFGDYVLKEISLIISGFFRKTDMIYRFGGEELAVILTETSLENALIPLERFRNKIAEHPFSYNGDNAQITVSIGISSSTQDMGDFAELIGCADKALYQAKQSGRNKTITHEYEECNKIL